MSNPLILLRPCDRCGVDIRVGDGPHDDYLICDLCADDNAVLHTLRTRGPQTVQAVADMLGGTAAAAAAVLDRLETSDQVMSVDGVWSSVVD